MIGQGHFGQVWAVEDRITRRTFACKSIPKNSAKFGVVEMKREIAAMKRVSGHESIVQLQSVHEDPESMHLVMDYCDGGELYEAVERHGRFPEKEAARVFKQLVSAVAYCHSQGVMHRDVKPENILLSASAASASSSSSSSAIARSGGNSGAVSGADSIRAAPKGVAAPREAVSVKLADFGLAVLLAKGEKASGIAGSPLYMAPEVVSSEYDFAADVWSLGVVLYILLCGAPPFGGKDDAQIMRSICHDGPDFSSPAWQSVSAEAKLFVRCLLVKDPARRPPAYKLLAHPWILVHTRGGRIVRRKVFAPNGRPVRAGGMSAAMTGAGFASPLRPRAVPHAGFAVGTPVRSCGSTSVAAALLSPLPTAAVAPAMTPAMAPLLSPQIGVTPILGRIAAMRVAGSPSPLSAPSVPPSPVGHAQWVAPSPVFGSPLGGGGNAVVVGSPWSAVVDTSPFVCHLAPISPCLALARKPLALSAARKLLTPSSTLAPPTLTHPSPPLPTPRASIPTPPTSGEFQLPPAAFPAAVGTSALPVASLSSLPAAACSEPQRNCNTSASSCASASSSSSTVPFAAAQLPKATLPPAVPALTPITPDATPVLGPSHPSTEPSPLTAPLPLVAPTAAKTQLQNSNLKGCGNFVTAAYTSTTMTLGNGQADDSWGSVGSAAGMAPASAALASMASGSVSSADLVLNGGGISGGPAGLADMPGMSSLRRCLFA
ncbi:unnamed protein product [Closterium sp. NIES-65]|nr:unnamed protein product [Closterium sp. NIES-65]